MGLEQLEYGLGLKMTRNEAKRLEELAKHTGRSKNSVIRSLLRLASVRDENGLALIRQDLRQNEGSLVNGL